MIKKRVLSVLLVLAMVLSMLPAVASAETETPEIKSVQLVLDSILGINLKVDLKDNPVANYTVEVAIGDAAVQKLSGSEDHKDGDLYVYTANLMAHQMTETIHIALKQGDTVLVEKDWSVKTNYVDVITADSTASDETKALVTAMYHYGQYAAYYKNGSADPAVSAVETAEDVAEAHMMSLEASVKLGAVAYLYLDEACDLCFKFNKDPMSGKTLWVDDAQVTPTAIGTQVQYKIEDILPQNYGDKHSVQVKDGDTVVFDLRYSVLSYMYQCQNKTGEDYVSLNKLMAAMRLYGAAAESYIATLPTYLTEANAGTPALFAATINKNPAGNYALKEDLDWTDETAKYHGVQTFSGTLDGQGYSIKGLALGLNNPGDDNWSGCLFGVNTGTIKNIAFEYSLLTAEGNAYGLIYSNEGLVENLFVKAVYTHNSWNTAAIAMKNSGTIQNCITDVSSSATTYANRVGSIVNVEYSGVIKNCYSINTANTVETPYIEIYSAGTYTNNHVYATNQTLLNGINTSADPFDGANGWSRFWKMTANGIAFGDELVLGGSVCVHKDEKPVDGICDNESCKMELALPAGVVLVNKDNASTPAAFKTLVETNPGYTYYLTEDLDWTGADVKGVAAFSGIFDGQGHSIKGFQLGTDYYAVQVGSDWYSCLFGANTGTIKNLSIEYTLVGTYGSGYAPIASNQGTIENLFVKAAFAANSGYNAAAIADINTGTIKNCIVSMSATAENKGNIGPVVYSERGGTIQNCHVVNPVNSITTPWAGLGTAGTYSGNGVYASDQALLDALTALPAADGWSDYWAITGEGITFGGNVVIAGQATQPCTHEDKSPVDGKCDLCSEAVALPQGTYLINSATVTEAGSLSALINANLAGHYYVTEDLTLAEQLAVGDFAGLLDGQGHTIKGLTVGMNANADWNGNGINSNSGTIQDIGLEYTIEVGNNQRNGLISTNNGTGTIQNVYVKATVKEIDDSQYNSAFVSMNLGTIKNCIVDVTLDASFTALDNTVKQFGVVASVNGSSAIIENCYYKYTAASGISVPAIFMDNSGKANVAALSETSTVNTADGWAASWSVELKGEKYGIWFGDTLVLAMTKPCTHTDTSYVDGKCDLCGEAVALPEGTYLINSQTAGTKAALATLIDADPDGKFYVTEDLTYTVDSSNGIDVLEGLLDGQGHTIKGIIIKYNVVGGSYYTSLIHTNKGTIQNIALEYTLTDGNDKYNALVSLNQGTIQNVYAKATVTLIKDSQYNGAFVSENAGTVKNCIVDVTLDASITTLDNKVKQFGVIASVNDSSAIIENCYYKYTATAGITVPAIFVDNSEKADAKALDENATVNSADGWSDCWKTDDTGIWFSSTLVMEYPACEHTDTAYVDGKCDKCGEAVDLEPNVYLINSTTAATKKDLVALINNDLAGTYYVTEDLAYTAENNTGIGDFTGVLDGQGHSISGIQFKYGTIDGVYDTFLFKSNSGTIQNLAVEYTILAANSEYFGLVANNSGIIQNVYAKVTMMAMKTGAYGSAFVGQQVKDSTAVIKNCIVDVTIDSSITSIGTQFGAIVGCNQAGTTVQNCYYTYTALDDITVPAISAGTVNWGTVTNVAALDQSVLSLPSADGWGSCWTVKLDGIWFGNMHVLDVEVAEEVIAVYSDYSATNVSDDTIAYKGSTEDDRANIFAWYDLQKLYREITGKSIEVVFVNSVSDLDDDRTYFILGDDLALSAQLETTGITADNGHKIVKSGDDVYLYGKSGYGTANAVYAFLKQAFGAEFYSDTVYTTTGSTYSIANINDATFNPSVDYNWAYDGLLYGDNGQTINYAYQMRMGFVNYWQIQGGSFHAFSELFADSDYTVDVDLNAGGTIGTSSTYVQAVADYVYEKATSGTNKKVIAVGPADTHTWSTSTASQANFSTYGANSGEYLLFMNAVIELLNTDSKYADIPAVEVIMLVYNGSLAAPTSNLDALTVDKNPARGVTLKAMFAPIEMNVNGSPTDSTIKDYYGNTPSYYYAEYAKWQNIFGADNVYFWRYSTIFNDFMVPVNTIKYIQENYQALVGSDNYIKHMMDQGTGKSPVQTNFQALLVYLKGQLGKDVNADLDTLITNFCKAYYGAEAGTYIKQLLTAEQAHLTTLSTTMNDTSVGFLGTGNKADISGCHSVPASSGGWFSSTNNLYAAKWWSANCSDDDGAMLKTWYGYITSALEKTTDAKQIARIQVEAIALRYISLKAHSVALVSDDSLAEVEADAIALGITRYSEGTVIENLA